MRIFTICTISIKLPHYYSLVVKIMIPMYFFVVLYYCIVHRIQYITYYKLAQNAALHLYKVCSDQSFL